MSWVAGDTIFLLGLLVFWLLSAMHPEWYDDGYETLYSNLSLAEADEVKNRLTEDSNIPVKLAEDGTSVRVPKEHLEEALVKMAQWGIPRSIDSSELYDRMMNFSSSDFEKEVILQRP